MTMAYPHGQDSSKMEALLASYEEAHPGLIKELDLLNIAIDEYDRMLAESEPRVMTTDNTVG